MILISLMSFALLHMLFPRKCLSSFDGTVKRSAIEIRRLVVIARCNMYWILKDCTNSVCTPCYAIVLLGTVYTCTHVAIRLQAVLIRKVLLQGFTHVSHEFVCLSVTALAVTS